MADNFSTFAPGLSDVATRHFAISPSDSADLAIKPRAIYCTVAGDAVIRDEAGTDITYPLTAGQILPFRGVRILATNTTATVVGWY
ncbi:spike base protein, RCAP_Rcc01079 family [Methylosinus sporium]|uniref:Uncharacterized protein n=1 Tax=Methylosinus sporium TaxID=428 RepID=A0A2U1SST4_METSR|nr:hypothetical protein [Methylosinus sporium]PWB94665.1 hypothetical protein C5689_06270 [Methylosinus sporium]